MLEVENITVEVGGREVIRDVSFSVDIGETLVLFGPNGSGKTTLLMAIMGIPRYDVTRGRIVFNGKDITHLPVDERSRMGIGILMQRPPVVRGVKMREIVKACLHGRENGGVIERLAQVCREDAEGLKH